MIRFADLPIRVKFFGYMSILLLVLFAVSATSSYRRQQEFILRFAVDNARIFANQLIQTRDYMSSVVKDEPEHNYNLVPQVVATRVARRVTQNSKFYVRQVSLRYRNPENRPDPYEADQLRLFAGNPDKEVYGLVQQDGDTIFRYMQPMTATASCLDCHGTYQSAPDFIKRRFPPGHFSYNYKVGEVIGAVSVSIPVKDLYAQLGTNLKLDLVTRGVVFLIVILVMAVIMSRQILDPVKRVSEGIVRATRTGDFQEKLEQLSRDEVGVLIGSYNDLMDELSRKTEQSREADERYRRFIELGGSAVVSFMKDGKIVIANQRAATLFGKPRQSLLGDSIFSYIEDGDALRAKLESGEAVREESSRHTVRGSDGKTVEVDLLISVSTADRAPIYSAVLRQREADKGGDVKP